MYVVAVAITLTSNDVRWFVCRRSRSSELHDGVPQGSTERSTQWPGVCVAPNQRLHRRSAKYR